MLVSNNTWISRNSTASDYSERTHRTLAALQPSSRRWLAMRMTIANCKKRQVLDEFAFWNWQFYYRPHPFVSIFFKSVCRKWTSWSFWSVWSWIIHLVWTTTTPQCYPSNVETHRLVAPILNRNQCLNDDGGNGRCGANNLLGPEWGTL